MDNFSVGDSFVHELTMVIEDIPKSYLIQECHDKINDTCTIHPIPGSGARISLRESLINKLKTMVSGNESRHYNRDCGDGRHGEGGGGGSKRG